MEVTPAARFHTRFGEFSIAAFADPTNGTHVALWTGMLHGRGLPLVRIQSSCLTSTALFGDVCDCAEQMQMALQGIASSNGGVFLYLDQEGRSLGLFQKVCGIGMMNQGEDTVTAYSRRGLEPDMRDYTAAGIILNHLQVGPAIRVMTNNPAKISSLKRQGFEVADRIPLEADPTGRTIDYLRTKKARLGHMLGKV